MAFSNKNSNSKVGKLFRHPTLLLFFVCLIVFVVANVYSSQKGSGALAAAPPDPSISEWLTNLNTYHARKNSYPPSLVELEREVWMPARASAGEESKTTRLEYGPRMFLFNNYAYLYQRDAQDPHICSLWAVPQGERYKEGNTFYVLITPQSVTAWRGGALDPDQIRAIPKAARPTGEDMARLGMYKVSSVPDAQKSSSFFGRFFN
jgi:hypothetical protein